MKKITAFALALLMVMSFAVVGASASDPDTQVTIPTDAATVEVSGVIYKVIRTADEFKAINDAKDNYILANDIDFGGAVFSENRMARIEAGTIIDGNGYALLNYSVTGDGDVSTFGLVKGDCIYFKNLTIGSDAAPISITSEVKGKSIGALLGYSNSTSSWENIKVYANVSGNTEGSNVAGLIGNAKGNHTLNNVTFNGSVTGHVTGGFIGSANANDTVFNLSDCVNNGVINGTNDTGGFIGKNTAQTTATNCINLGAVTSTGGAGGFCGSVSCVITLDKFLGAGKVQGKNNVGGVYGYCGGNGSITTNSYVVGTVESSNVFVGGMLAFSKASYTVKDCGFFGNLVLTNTTENPKTTGVICGKITDEALKEASGNVFTAVEGATINVGLTEGQAAVSQADAVEKLKTVFEDYNFAVENGAIVVAAKQPATGDSFPMAAVIVMFVSLVGIVGVAAFAKKRIAE